jgi:hypothetical protein
MGKPANTIFSLLEKIDPEGGLHACWNWTGGKHQDGYGVIRYEGKRYKAHRLFYKYFIKNISDDLVVRHVCDNPACCNPMHLIHGTQADNIRDMYERNRAVCGKAPWKLSKEKRKQILALRKEGMSTPKIAKLLNCATATVWRYATGKVI